MRPTVFVLCATMVPAFGQTPVPAPAPVSLRELSVSLENLTSRVRPAVVQVFTTAYAPLTGSSEDSGTTTSLFSKQRGSGSGVIVSADGYIVTNNHVVENGTRIQVRVAAVSQSSDRRRPAGKTYRARVVGVDPETDVAVLKIDASPLPHLALGDSDSLRQGQLVMAFGNPLGLESSVSMGVVSSVARQLRPDDPMTYVQTDAPINPGNSGGPLIDSEGRVMGLNTFIFTQSGGSEGIGFAVPSNIVRTVYQQILKDGHVHRGRIGVYPQTITEQMAKGLALPQEDGVIIADVMPDGPADKAGVKVGDVVVSLNGRPMESVRQFEVNIYRQRVNQTVNLDVLRDGKKLTLVIPVLEREDDPMRFRDMVDEKNLVPKLGILAIEITEELAGMLDQLRHEHGLLVAARSTEAAANGLKAGDVIYSVNRTPVVSVKGLQASLDNIGPRDPVVLQVQRGERMMYLSIDLE